ncbi:hypothetical protein ON010_g15011 [Phytophthora cinnamomi]|nr:hypothetical protein ON010_g15011 [Phytophthora cinnamomi]
MKSSKTRQSPQQPTVSMIRLAVATVAADLPVALVEYSNGIVILYDVRTAEAVGSFWLTSSPATTPTPRGVISIMGNQEVLGVAVTPNEEETEMRIKVYSWRDILLVSFPSVATLLEQRQEEPTISNIKQLLLTSDIDEFSTPAPPPTITVPSTSADSIEVVLLKMAGELPPSPSRTRQSNASSPSPLQSPLARSSVSIASRNAALPGQYTEDIDSSPMLPGIMLEPLVPDDMAFFEQYCQEHLDPLVIADKEAKLHRKRRELLKTMSAGGAW